MDAKLRAGYAEAALWLRAKRSALREETEKLTKAIAFLERINEESKHSKGEAVQSKKDPAAVSLGRRGGLKGGKARAEKLSAKKRSNIAKKAAQARWRRSG